MHSPEHWEHDLRSAVRAFATAVDTGQRGVGEMSVLDRATAALPLSNLAYWEKVVRSEFALALRPAFFSGRLTWAKPGRFLTWIDLASWDGYIRERTLRALSGPAPNAFYFALAVRRLNDWVPQVRIAAKEKLVSLAKVCEPAHVVDALCAMLPTWTSWGRADETERQLVADILGIQHVAAALRRRIVGASAGPMATVLSQAARTSWLDEHFVQMAREAVQPAVRAAAYRALLSGSVVWVEGRQWQWTDVRYCQGRLQPVVGRRALEATPPLQETLMAAAADRSSTVRTVAAEVLIREMKRLGTAVLPLAGRLAADASRRVAQRGAFALQQLEAHPAAGSGATGGSRTDQR